VSNSSSRFLIRWLICGCTYPNTSAAFDSDFASATHLKIRKSWLSNLNSSVDIILNDTSLSITYYILFLIEYIIKDVRRKEGLKK
jgi:hypothetical protein